MVQMPDYDGEFFNAGRQYFAHGLPAWKDFVLNDLKATSLADYGCGQGDWLEPFEGIIPVWGCDGYADEAHLRVKKENFSKLMLGDVLPKDLPVDAFVRSGDVVMSLEAMEHVANDKEGNFLDCMLNASPRLVVFSVASGWGTYRPEQFKLNRLDEKVPGGPDWHLQWGRHHANCQPVDVVIDKMHHRGYDVNEELSNKFRTLKVPSGKGNRTRLAFASFYRKNTRVYTRR